MSTFNDFINFGKKGNYCDIINMVIILTKRKKKIKKTFKLFFSFIFIVGLLICSYFIYNKYFKEKEITSEVNKLMLENDISTEKYSKTLEYVLLNNLYDEAYLDEYSDIEYNDNENFASILTTFLPLGYSGKEINYIFKLSNKNIEKLSKSEYIDITNYYNITNFNVDNIDRYNQYYESNNYSYQDVVTYVNINLDLKAYSVTKEVEDPNNLLVLVNKYNFLPNNYKPEDLTYVLGAYGNNVPMREVIKEPFIELQKAAEEEIGIILKPTTAFRDQSFQNTLYNNYVAKDGVEAADTYSARPGFSEHQTGLAIDLKNTLISSSTRLNDSDFEWLSNNAHRFGFIIRYPKEKVDITGYQFENWHIRYVGLNIAKTIYENNLTLEEYIDLYITEY